MRANTKKKRPPVTELQRVLDYQPETGELIWRVRVAQRSPGGSVAGSLTDDGYVAISFRGARLKAHRVAMALTLGKWPEEEVDHINGDRADNRLENLRLATHSENRCNVRSYRNNKSGHKGVFWHKREGKWAAQITKDKKHRHLGYFSAKEDAVEAYRTAAAMHHGEFANVGGAL